MAQSGEQGATVGGSLCTFWIRFTEHTAPDNAPVPQSPNTVAVTTVVAVNTNTTVWGLESSTHSQVFLTPGVGQTLNLLDCNADPGGTLQGFYYEPYQNVQ